MSDKEKAVAYRQMFELFAWKDFQANLVDEKQAAINSMVASDDMKDIHVSRGIIKCLNSIESFLEHVSR